MAYQNNNVELTQEDWAVINGIITKSNTKNKVLDFRNNLTQPYSHDYAALFGAGGKDHAPTAGINVVICDSSRKPSVTVKYNLTVDDVLLLCAGMENYADTYLLDSTNGLIQDMVGLYNRLVSAGADQAAIEEVKRIGAQIRNMKNVLSGDQTFPFKREKCNVYKRNAQTGIGPVSMFEVKYQPEYNGKPSNYPWYIHIVNGMAPINIDQTLGKTTYDGSKMQDKQEAFINLATPEFKTDLLRVRMFMDKWLNAVSLSSILDGIAQKEFLLRRD